MKKGIIVFKNTTNIGDDIQSYATYKFMKKVDYVIDRESINNFVPNKTEAVGVITNGWYQHDRTSFPFSEYIYPHMVAMHINCERDKSGIYDEYLSGYTKDYFISKGLVGCRDYYTLNKLKAIDVPAYYTGCLTLTIDINNISKKEYICVVDVNEKIIDYIKKNTKYEVKVMTHTLDPEINSKLSFEERMHNVEKLLEIYSNAICVVTTRLHVALPCLALKTKVLMIYYEKYKDRLYDFLEYLNWSTEERFLTGGTDYDVNEPKDNPTQYLHVRETLTKSCQEFVAKLKNVDESMLDLTPVKYAKKYIDIKEFEKNLMKISFENKMRESTSGD